MSEIDLERALKNPAGLFGNPDAVVHHPTLAREQKAQTLNNWQLDKAWRPNRPGRRSGGAVDRPRPGASGRGCRRCGCAAEQAPSGTPGPRASAAPLLTANDMTAPRIEGPHAAFAPAPAPPVCSASLR